MKKTLVNLITFNFLMFLIKSCRVSEDFVFPNIKDSYPICGAVLVGTVENLPTKDVLDSCSIYIKDAVYFKGCGPSEVKISGYSSGARCGVYPPRTGKRIIAFVCGDPDDPNNWVLHRFAPFSGQFSANKRHLHQLEKVSGGQSICNYGGFSSQKCQYPNKVQ